MKNRYDVQSRSKRWISAAASLLGAVVMGCSGADADSAADDESVDAVALDLHAVPGVPALPWRGKPPSANQQNSNQAGLNVVYGLSIGVKKSGLIGQHKVVVGLQVCWYTPSNANNTYVPGNPFGCTTIGSQTADSWTSQQCSTNEVVSGYRVGLFPSGDIAKFATLCRSVTNPNVRREFGFAGDSSVLFADTLECKQQLGKTAYIEYFSANPGFTGFNGSCVLP
jgi:hypothetical protein